MIQQQVIPCYSGHKQIILLQNDYKTPNMLMLMDESSIKSKTNLQTKSKNS